MADELAGMTVAFLVAPEAIEQGELTAPWRIVEETGGTPTLVSTEAGKVATFHHVGTAGAVEVDRATGEVSADEFDALVLTGGEHPARESIADPDIAFVRSFFHAGKPVAAKCHAPWMLVAADVVRGRRLTSSPDLRADIVTAGGEWVDEAVAVDREGVSILVTGRNPGDVASFDAAVAVEFARAHRRLGRG